MLVDRTVWGVEWGRSRGGPLAKKPKDGSPEDGDLAPVGVIWLGL